MEIIAHRGASFDAPENTLAAVRLAWKQGADAVECDVHLTYEGQLAVIHDRRTTRTADASLRVAAATMTELRQLDAGGWKNAKFTGEKIPTLDELLALVPAKKRVFVEVKSGPASVAALTRSLKRRAFAAHQVVVISFDFETVRAAKRLSEKIDACWIIERDSAAGRLPLREMIARAKSTRLDGLDLEATFPIDPNFVQQIHAAGIKLYVWTLDDPERARSLIDAGVDGIATNRPGWLREQLAR